MSKPDIQMMLMRIRSKIKATTLTDVAREIGVSRQFVDRIINADYPSALRIESKKKELVEKKYAELFGESQDDSISNTIRLPAKVSFFRLIKHMNRRNICTQKIARDIGVNPSTVFNYSRGVNDPTYKNGVKIINYAVNHLDINELRSAGVISD